MDARIRFAAALLGLALSFGGCASSAPQSSQDEMARRIRARIDTDQIAREAVAKVTGDFFPAPHDNAVLWQITATALMSDDITGLRLVSPDRLLLAIEGRNPRLINADNGSTVWEQKTVRFDESSKVAKGKSPAPAYPSAAYVTVHRDTIVLRADGAGGTKILAAETATGNGRWTVEVKKSGNLDLIPFPEDGILLAVRQDKRRAALSAYSLATGALVWKKETAYGSGTSEPPGPAVDGDAAVLFYDGVERLSAATGKAQWRRPEILGGRQSPPVQSQEGRLYVLDGKNALHVLDARTGKTVASGKQRDGAAYTNVYPLGDRVYLRGVEKGTSGASRFFVAAVRADDAREIWADYDTDPSVSNLIDEDGRLFHSTPFTVVALDRESGKRVFAARASDLGKSFPVRIARYGDRVVYIGELVVAAYDAKTGNNIYRHGFDPVNQTAHMDALNEMIDSKAKWLSWFTGPLSDWDLKGLGFSTFFFQQASASQNQATAYRQQSQQLRARAFSSPLSAGAESAALQSDVRAINARVSDAAARAEFAMGMAFMTVENIQRAAAEVTAADRAKLQDLLRIRKLLYAAYVGTQQGDYVCRPTKEAGKVGISIVHLPSGRASTTVLTQEYKEIGVFCLVDFDRGIIYHPAVTREVILDAYFIARPANIPR